MNDQLMLRHCAGGEPYRSWSEVAVLLRCDQKLRGTPSVCHACYYWHIKPLGVARTTDPIEPLVTALGY